MRSIRRQMVIWLLAIVLAGVGLAGWMTYRQAQVEANELFDYQLEQTAAALPAESFSSVLGAQDQPDEGVVIQIWRRDGVQLYYSHPRVPLAQTARLGFSTEHTPRGDWRVYSAIVGDNVVQLAQPMSVRNELAAGVAWRTIWPLIVLLPLLGVAIWSVVGRGLRPLGKVTRAVDSRRPDALDPLPDARLPVEVRPLVRALNGLLDRLAHALDTQRAFVADAAHELRSPLAALQIQLQLLERARDAAQRREALDDLKHGVSRATRLVEQLLALARAEPASTALSADVSAKAEPVDLRALVEECVRAYAPLASQRGVDLGVEHAEPVAISGDADALRVMFNNLIDNAVKYTPRGGRIDVAVRTHRDAGDACVEIADSGPGIPPDERERVFDRFYRMPAPDHVAEGCREAGAADVKADTDTDTVINVSGSGLGLAIVQRIATQHGAAVELTDTRDGHGLRVIVRFRLS